MSEANSAGATANKGQIQLEGTDSVLGGSRVQLPSVHRYRSLLVWEARVGVSGRAIVSYQVPRHEIPRDKKEGMRAGAEGESQGQHLVEAEAIGKQGNIQDAII